MGRVIGIDLGTTTSEIAYIKNGKPEIIVNRFGSRITPSVVGLTDDNELIVGEKAKGQAILKPDRTVMEVKRLMGTNQRVSLGGKNLLPQEISAMILKELKRSAEDYLGEEVTEAVITVPSNFTDLQRQATKSAGRKAGLKIERIINEPTAAALAYGINNLNTEENVLVYDLGGGTFDVTVLELFDGILDIKASRGNNKLGGKDFDDRIIEYVVKKFKDRHGINLRENRKAMARIKDAAEKAKIELTTMKNTNIEVPFITVDKDNKPLAIKMRLTREMFEKLISDLVKSTEREIDDAMNAAGFKPEDISTVIAVGGSSKIPCVRRLLVSKFGDKIRDEVNPDEAIALGAAIQAGIKNDEISSKKSVVITDACRYTLGTSIIINGEDRVLEGIYDPIIMRDSKIPCTVKKNYFTVEKNQTRMTIDVYQGDEKKADDNISIGEFVLDGIPAKPAGEEEIEVSFTYDLNGILKITAKVLSNGKCIEGIIDTTKLVREEQLSEEELEKWSTCRLAYKGRDVIELGEKKLESLNGELKLQVKVILDNIKRAIISDNESLIQKYDNELTDLLFNIV